MDLLACPHCKNFPLRLYVISKKERKPILDFCEVFCSFTGGKPDRSMCGECGKVEIEEGVIICERCGRWFPVTDGIPIMLPDGLIDEYRKNFEKKHGVIRRLLKKLDGEG